MPMGARTVARIAGTVLLALAAGACGAPDEDDAASAGTDDATATRAGSSDSGRRGDGAGVDADDAGDATGGAIDEALAERGEALFGSKGCVACHTIDDGRLVGPELAGVTDRRERAWVLAIIQNPDSMLRDDPDARALLAQYGSPMTDLGVTADEAAALYEYLRAETLEHRGGDDDADEEDEVSSATRPDHAMPGHPHAMMGRGHGMHGHGMHARVRDDTEGERP